MKEFYSTQDVSISRDNDQYSTDFGKNINKILERPEMEAPDRKADISKAEVVVLGGLGGRVDHGIGLLSEIAREQRKHESVLRFWLVSESNVSFVLDGPPPMSRDESEDRKTSQKYILKIPSTATVRSSSAQDQPIFTANVGILPIFGPARISTLGLEWDVEHWHTEMGGQVSTSNHLVEETVSIETDARVLFTVERTLA